MADHKSQHYVPRCHLRPFSLKAEGAAINVFNISRMQPIRNAPVKGQCAKPYFYGVDLQLERLLQVAEGEYAQVVRKLEAEGYVPTVDDLELLRLFAYLQYSRTDMAMRRIRLMHTGVHETVFRDSPNAPELDVSDQSLTESSIRMFGQIRHYTEDLKICIVKNETLTDFVTSDDPAIFTSRFYVQRLHKRNFGVMSTGALFMLPITPRLLALCYDGGAYTIPQKRDWYFSVNRASDILALNKLQYLKAAENIYFSRWEDRIRIEEEFRAVMSTRPQTWHRISVLVRDLVTETHERYRTATEEEAGTAEHTLLHVSNLQLAPTHWISQLKFRQPIRTFSNGTGVGHVRRPEWLVGREPAPPYNFESPGPA